MLQRWPAWCTLYKCHLFGPQSNTAMVTLRLPVTRGPFRLKINGGKGQSDSWTWTRTRFSPNSADVPASFCVFAGGDSRELGLSCGHKSPAEEECFAAPKKTPKKLSELRTPNLHRFWNATRAEPSTGGIKGNTLSLHVAFTWHTWYSYWSKGFLFTGCNREVTAPAISWFDRHFREVLKAGSTKCCSRCSLCCRQSL